MFCFYVEKSVLDKERWETETSPAGPQVIRLYYGRFMTSFVVVPRSSLEMAVEQGASPVISNVFLADLSHEMENDGVETGRNSPHLSMQSLNELESSEKSGIPLNSAWTLWHDK